MSAHRTLFGLCLLGSLLLAGQPAQGQSDSSTPAMKYFGQRARGATIRPRPQRPAPAAQTTLPLSAKPFQNISRGPTVTPYLQLDALETTTGIPNYYSRVLPQMQQNSANQAQANQLQKLQQQLRVASHSSPISNTRNGGVPTTGHSSQFLNNGGYYPGLKR